MELLQQALRLSASGVGDPPLLIEPMVPALQTKDRPLPGVHIVLYGGITGRAHDTPRAVVGAAIPRIVDVCVLEAVAAPEGYGSQQQDYAKHLHFPLFLTDDRFQ